jgi:hypothetical protein
MAGSAASRASNIPNDHPAIFIAASSPGGAGKGRAAHEKGPTGIIRTAFHHDHRRTVGLLPFNNHAAEMVSYHLDNIAAARNRDGIAHARRLH